MIKELNNKTYKKIPTLENYYISEDGDLYSEYRNRELTPNYNTGAMEYPIIQLRDNGVNRSFPVHKLVALAWIPLPEGYTFEDVSDYRNRVLVLDHIDGNKLNFKASNLRWCTPFENIMFNNYDRVKRCEKLKGNQNAKGKKPSISNIRYEYCYNGKTYSLKDICKELKCSKSKITESFRRNMGLVKLGVLTRKIKATKQEITAIKEGIKAGVFLPRELTEEEIEALNLIFIDETKED